MGLFASQPQTPLPWVKLALSIVALWIAPVLVGAVGLLMYNVIGKTWADFGLGVWFFANALFWSPLFSWIGWLIALPPVALALRYGWFGWATAALIGAAAGFLAGEAAQSEIALPFGIIAILALRLVLGRALPL